MFVLPAALSKLYDENKISEVKIYLKYSLKYFLSVGIPSVFGLTALSMQILMIFSTSEIAEKSYFVIPVIALGLILFGIYAIISQILVIKKKMKIAGMIWTAAAILNIGFNLMLIPFIGMLGGAIATVFAYFFALAAAWYYSFKELRFEIDVNFILKSLFASAVMATFVFWLKPDGLSKTMIAIVAGAILYGILIFILRGFDKKEINLIKKILKISV